MNKWLGLVGTTAMMFAGGGCGQPVEEEDATAQRIPVLVELRGENAPVAQYEQNSEGRSGFAGGGATSEAIHTGSCPAGDFCMTLFDQANETGHSITFYGNTSDIGGGQGINLSLYVRPCTTGRKCSWADGNIESYTNVEQTPTCDPTAGSHCYYSFSETGCTVDGTVANASANSSPCIQDATALYMGYATN